MIDLTAPQSSSDAYLTKVAVRRDGNTDDGLLFDCDVAFDVQTSGDADIVENLLPGARALFEQSQVGEERKTTMRANIADRSYHVSVADMDGTVMVEASSEIRSVEYKVDPTRAMLTIRLRLFGVHHDLAGAIVGLLGKPVVLAGERPQQVLPFNKPEDDGPPVQHGQRVVVTTQDKAGNHAFGMVMQDLDETSLEVSNFTRVSQINKDDVISRLVIRAPDDEPLHMLLSEYHQQARNLAIEPDWQWILLALGQRHSEDLSAASMGALVLDDEIIESALEIARGAGQ